MTGNSDIEHEGAVRAFEWADPARRLPTAEPTVDADTYLFDLLVADPEALPTDGTRRLVGRLGPALVAAAAAVAIIGWLFGPVGGSGPTRVATDPALTPAETPPTAERRGAPANRPDQAQSSWEAITPWATGERSRGRYRSTNFQPEVSFVVTDGWTRPAGSIEVPDGLAPLAREGRPAAEGLYLAHHKDDDSIAQWLIRMREHPAITVESVETRELGHVTGMEVRFQVVSPMTYVSLTDEHRRVLEAGQAGVALVADVESRVVSALVLAESGAELPDIEAAARPILESLHWRSSCHHP